MEQKSSEFGVEFQKQERWIAAAATNASYTPGQNSGKKEVSEIILSLLFYDLLHHRQIFVWTPENGGSESQNPPNFWPKHLVREGVVLLQ